MLESSIHYFSLYKDHSSFFPLLYIRASHELIIGCFSLKERVEMMKNEYEKSQGEDLKGSFFFASEVFLSLDTIKDILDTPKREGWVKEVSLTRKWELADGSIAVYYFSDQNTEFLDKEKIDGEIPLYKKISQEEGFSFQNLESIIEKQDKMLKKDLFCLKEKRYLEYEEKEEWERVLKHPLAEIHPTAVLDTKKGPIYVGEGAEIQALSYIEGPCFIGDKTIIAQAKVRQSYIGEDCRLGGEISHSILLSYSNKAHDGYLGYSYVGSWVNLGALCSTSDLKNNYSPISLYGENAQKRGTSLLKIGSFIGDFSTLGIGSLLNTGSVVGIGCNLANPSDFLPKYNSSFLWQTSERTSLYRWESFIETLKIRMERRGKILNKEEEEYLKAIHHKSSSSFKEGSL